MRFVFHYSGMCSEVSTNYKDIPIDKRHELFQPSAPNPWDIKSKLLFQLASTTFSVKKNRFYFFNAPPSLYKMFETNLWNGVK